MASQGDQRRDGQRRYAGGATAAESREARQYEATGDWSRDVYCDVRRRRQCGQRCGTVGRETEEEAEERQAASAEGDTRVGARWRWRCCAVGRL